MYSATIRMRNKRPFDQSGMIYAGTVIETVDPFSRVQNLSVARNVLFTIPAGQTQTVTVPAWCLNRSFSAPRTTPMRLTAFTVQPFASQTEAWDDMGRRR
jgi:hypothetical protein